MADDLHFLQLTELAAYIKAGEISPLEATRAQLDRIAALDGTLGSYVHVMADAAMAQAETAQAEIMAGRYRGPRENTWAAARNSDCAERPVLDEGLSDGCRYRRSQELPAGGRRKRGTPAE